MSASASDRHRLHSHLEQLLGPEDAATLMEHLPPSEWADLVTRADLGGLREEVRAVREDLRSDLRDLERRLTEQFDLRVKATVGESTRVLFFSMLASQATLVGMVLAATQLG